MNNLFSAPSKFKIILDKTILKKKETSSGSTGNGSGQIELIESDSICSLDLRPLWPTGGRLEIHP